MCDAARGTLHAEAATLAIARNLTSFAFRLVSFFVVRFLRVS
jgi:hypothetical protein